LSADWVGFFATPFEAPFAAPFAALFGAPLGGTFGTKTGAAEAAEAFSFLAFSSLFSCSCLKELEDCFPLTILIQ